MAAKIQPPSFSLLRDEGTSVNPTGGGDLSVPPEFDVKQFAVKWAKEGAEVSKAQARDFLIGTKYSAPGWEVWRYPKTVQAGVETEGKEKGKPKTEPHPLADQPHKAPLSGGTYVLMFRPLAVQTQVNQAYALLSRERMKQEVKGETLSVPGDNTGVLTEEQLLKIYGKEADAESDGAAPEAVMHGGPGDDTRLGHTQRVSR